MQNQEEKGHNPFRERGGKRYQMGGGCYHKDNSPVLDPALKFALEMSTAEINCSNGLQTADLWYPDAM